MKPILLVYVPIIT